MARLHRRKIQVRAHRRVRTCGRRLVRSRKGVADLKVVFRGRSAHAGNNPQDGANANVAAMRFSLACYELADSAKGTTVNPGIIAGGTATNVIPDSCEVRFDLRYCFDKDGSDLENQIFELAERSWPPAYRRRLSFWASPRPCRCRTTRRH